MILAWVSATLPVTAQSRVPQADLSRLVVVGDSLSAGFQNGSLLDSQQVHGYASVVAAQAGTPLVFPLIAPPGIPNVLELVSPGPPPIIIPAPGTSTGRDDPAVQVTDLAVPGANLHDVLDTRPSFPIDDFTDLILGLPGLFGSVSLSQLEWAEALHPTTLILWVGNNDALGPALAADPALLTPVPIFRADFKTLMKRLAATGATIVVANVPDVTAVPALTPAEEIAEAVGLPISVIDAILGIGPGDLVTPQGIALIPAILANPSLGPLPASVVLTKAGASQIRAAVDAYNEIIATETFANGGALVDIHSLNERAGAHGRRVNGRLLTTEFLGGLFSLDGIHPTNTGYAILANAFIKTLNREFAAGMPPISVEQVAKTDPLILPVIEPPDLKTHVDPATADAMRDLFTGRRRR
jgi:lysophospholipase L1-like esterase